jgi:hypothetical protein
MMAIRLTWVMIPLSNPKTWDSPAAICCTPSLREVASPKRVAKTANISMRSPLFP